MVANLSLSPKNKKLKLWGRLSSSFGRPTLWCSQPSELKLEPAAQPQSHFCKFFPYGALHISILRERIIGIRQGIYWLGGGGIGGGGREVSLPKTHREGITGPGGAELS